MGGKSRADASDDRVRLLRRAQRTREPMRTMNALPARTSPCVVVKTGRKSAFNAIAGGLAGSGAGRTAVGCAGSFAGFGAGTGGHTEARASMARRPQLM
jgi:hypothetical protein